MGNCSVMGSSSLPAMSRPAFGTMRLLSEPQAAATLAEWSVDERRGRGRQINGRAEATTWRRRGRRRLYSASVLRTCIRNQFQFMLLATERGRGRSPLTSSPSPLSHHTFRKASHQEVIHLHFSSLNLSNFDKFFTIKRIHLPFPGS